MEHTDNCVQQKRSFLLLLYCSHVQGWNTTIGCEGMFLVRAPHSDIQWMIQHMISDTHSNRSPLYYWLRSQALVPLLYNCVHPHSTFMFCLGEWSFLSCNISLKPYPVTIIDCIKIGELRTNEFSFNLNFIGQTKKASDNNCSKS